MVYFEEKHVENLNFFFLFVLLCCAFTPDCPSKRPLCLLFHFRATHTPLPKTPFQRVSRKPSSSCGTRLQFICYLEALIAPIYISTNMYNSCRSLFSCGFFLLPLQTPSIFRGNQRQTATVNSNIKKYEDKYLLVHLSVFLFLCFPFVSGYTGFCVSLAKVVPQNCYICFNIPFLWNFCLFCKQNFKIYFLS